MTISSMRRSVRCMFPSPPRRRHDPQIAVGEHRRIRGLRVDRDAKAVVVDVLHAVAACAGGRRHDVGERPCGGTDPEMRGALRGRRGLDADARLRLSSSSMAEALHSGHSPAGMTSPGAMRSQAFFRGPHRSVGPFQPQYWQVAVGIMAWSSVGVGRRREGRDGPPPRRTSGGDPDVLAQGAGWRQGLASSP